MTLMMKGGENKLKLKKGQRLREKIMTMMRKNYRDKKVKVHKLAKVHHSQERVHLSLEKGHHKLEKVHPNLEKAHPNQEKGHPNQERVPHNKVNRGQSLRKWTQTLLILKERKMQRRSRNQKENQNPKKPMAIKPVLKGLRHTGFFFLGLSAP